MAQGQLYIMAGLPGSGKSTWANSQNDGIVISRDSIRSKLTDFAQGYYSNEKAVYREFTRQIQEELGKGNNVYADQTSLNDGSRRKLLNALNLEKSPILVYMDIPFEICLERNAKRAGISRVPDKDMASMARGLYIGHMPEIWFVGVDGSIEKEVYYDDLDN